MREAAGTRSQEKAWQMAWQASVHRVRQGSASPSTPHPQPRLCQQENLSIPKAPKSRCRGRAGFHGQFLSLPPAPPPSPSLPLPPALPVPVPHSSPHVQGGAAHRGVTITCTDKQIPENPCCRSGDVPFLPPIPSRDRGDVPAPGWPSAHPCHLPVPCRPAGRGIIAQWKDM